MPRPSPWTPAALSKLGNVAASEIAADIGVTVAAVYAKCKRLGIPAAGVTTGPKPRGPSSGRDVKVRLTDGEREAFEAAAGGKPISTWLRDLGLAEVGRQVAGKSAKRNG